MKSIERVAIVGAGALGALYADLLSGIEGVSVTFIAEGDRYDRLSDQKLHVNNQPLSTLVQTAHNAGVCDLVIIAVKHQHMPETVREIQPMIGADTVVISVLNGLDSEEMLSAAFPKANILYCIAVGMDAVRSGTNVTYQNQGKLVFGEAENTEKSEPVLLVQQLFDRAGLQYDIPVEMLKAVWWKFMINVGINQVSAVARAPYGMIQQSEWLQNLMMSLMQEVILVAGYTGVSLGNADLEKWQQVFQTLGAEGKTSMLQDVEAERLTEVDIFAGKVMALAGQYGVDVPVNRVMYQLIKTQESTFK